MFVKRILPFAYDHSLEESTQWISISQAFLAKTKAFDVGKTYRIIIVINLDMVGDSPKFKV